MATKTREKIEFGDFQTPDSLARESCIVLQRMGVSPASVVEPTCGKGAFLRACVEAFPGIGSALGVEVNPDYAIAAQEELGVRVECDDFFDRDWRKTLDALCEPVLVIGNPPWVTNSAVGSLRGTNLPDKSNFKRHSGLDAMTGKGNFDISEWMLLHLLERLSGRRAVLAMLCKTVVARKVLVQAWSRKLQLSAASTFRIDAAEHFGASVEACLLVCQLEPKRASQECAVYSGLQSPAPISEFALRDNVLVADLHGFEAFRHLAGTSPIKWRSGVKHDCSAVMELRREAADSFVNGLGSVVTLEESHLYPMLKSSEVMKAHLAPSRYMLVTQRSVGEDTAGIATCAPLTWSYLQANADRLDRRASSIYRNRSRFSMFGVGPYTFAPWKVATSGFYKRLEFRCVGPIDGKPVVLDDTCYFLPCRTEEDALILKDLLDSPAARGFYLSFVFWDAKRPITAQLLASLDLGVLAKSAGVRLPSYSEGPQDAPLFGA